MPRAAAPILVCLLFPCAAACTGAYPTGPGTSGSTSGAAASSGENTASSSGSAAGGSTGAAAASTAGAGTTGTAGTSGAGATVGGIGVSASSTGSSGAGPGTGTGTAGGAASTGGETSGSTGGSGGDAGCDPACAGKLSCCKGSCVDLAGDSFNCGDCGKLCASGDYCSDSKCVPATCPELACTAGEGCCASQCCGPNQVCCFDNGIVATFLCQDLDAGSCPISCAPMCVSRRDAKRDIEYLDEADLRSAEAQVLKIPLARFNYKADAPGERRRLGFIIEDVAPSPGVIDEARGMVDLYGYTSLAVAALQEQQKEIERLRVEVQRLEKSLDGAKRSTTRRKTRP